MARLRHEVATPLGAASLSASVIADNVGALAALAPTIEAALDGGQRAEWTRARAAIEEGELMLRACLAHAEQVLRLYAPTGAPHDPAAAPQLKAFDLAACLRRVLRLSPWVDDDRRQGIRCEVDCPEGIVVRCDEVGWYQVITNLLNNTGRHGYPQGGERKVSIVGRTLDDGRRIRLTYHDNGVGMSAAARARLLDANDELRADAPTLGLRIVDDVVAGRLGGRLKLPAPVDGDGGFIAHIDVTLATPRRADAPAR